MSLTYQQKKALKRLKVRLYRTDLRRFSLERLKEEFSTQSGKRIVKARLIRNIIHQAATWMKRGKIPKVEGNLRSLYYQWIKPVFARIPDGIDSKFDPYDEMLDVLELFVGELKLFRYRDLEIVDGKWQNRWYSKGKNPNIIVFAEKNGFVHFLQQMHRKYDITAVALGGSPSHLSSEYLAEGLRKRSLAIGPLILLAVTDYDPSGLSIQQAFVAQLEQQGLEIQKVFSLIEPKHYSEDFIEIFQFPVPKSYKTRLDNWLSQTNGINGEPFGLEADSMPKSQLRELLDQTIQPFLLASRD